ncbi:S-adenosylmethionine tRNA ribosyltransferase [Neosynechococcus sphagnicola sy1]|uniref:S-adenosylmethionine:tRNA ribosyltransferase-isomerase n=1 Tax=Neosynechococcus sphagnicola sy1 TaxID=1497020 RepID=A0A098TLC5_9CYAN|nr:S-adenosylmethionine tRNA ribosyltransferase [Neosynechococcus sphagnicola sy1]
MSGKLTASDRSLTSAPDASSDYDLAAYHFELPAERIAQNPVTPRDESRLLVVESTQRHRHCIFRDLPQLLRPGDLLVLNDTRVIPARLYGHKVGGTMVEVLLLEPRSPDCWLALVKPGKRLPPGTLIKFTAAHDPGLHLQATVLERDAATGGRILQFQLQSGNDSLAAALAAVGQVPLPPYITASQADPEQYQTVYAQRPGAVAAPTAGLHFTPELLSQLTHQGIEQTCLTLHVGVGTFRPVNTEDIRNHTLHGEWVEVPAPTVEKIQQTQARGDRVIAVGTTVARALEAAAQVNGLQPFCGKTNLYIYPGYQWQVVDGLITNFHLPGSSLLMLVSALIGRQRLLDLYQGAIDQNYRFYSFGDAMLVLPEARWESGHP